MSDDLLDKIKKKLQTHLGDGLVIVVGSGLSCAEGLPSMSDISEFLEKNIPKILPENEIKSWEQIATALKSDGLEAALSQYPPTDVVEQIIVKLVGDYIYQKEQELLQTLLFQQNKRLAFSRLLAHVLKPQEGIPVITTNYDRLIEIAAENSGIGVDTMFPYHYVSQVDQKLSRKTYFTEQSVVGSKKRFRYRTRVKLFKPHGSLDWYQTPQGPVRYQGNFSENRLIITPGTNKYRQGYNTPFDLHRDEGNKCIDNASRLLIIGYGFNDDHLETHLEKKIRSGAPTVILSRSLSPKAQEISKLANVVGIERVADGSRIISGEHSKEITLSNIIMWNLNGFISEVLEI